MEQTAKIYIAGHRGMVGSGLERKLRKEGYNNIVTRTSAELDLSCLLYTSPSPRDYAASRMPSSA